MLEKRLLRVPRTARRSNQSVLTAINPEYSLEGQVLKLKLQFFARGHTLEKTLPFPSPGDLPDPGIEPRSPAQQADSLLTELPEKPSAGDLGSIPGSGRPPGVGNGNPF